MRIILFSGKGGVGKTSISAATAVQSSKLGYKTVVLSTDGAHSLSDSFDIKLSGETRRITKNLYGMEIDVQKEVKENWSDIQKFLSQFISSQGLDNVIAEEMAIFPGMEELSSLLHIKKYSDEKKYDVCIADCAPTAGTLRLLSFPEIMNWYMKKLFPIERNTVKAIRPVAKHFLSIPLPSDDVFSSIENLYIKMGNIKEILTSKSSTIRLVLNPEKMVINETRRAFTYLNLFGFRVDAVIANRMLPDEVSDPYFEKWKDAQQKYMGMVKDCFSPLPILNAKLFEQEIVGLELLDELSDNVYENNDPAKVFYEGRPFGIAKENDEYVLSLNLPFAEKKDINLFQKADELIVRVGGYKRNILLPRTMHGLSVKEAKFREDKLKIKFGGEGNEEEN